MSYYITYPQAHPFTGYQQFQPFPGTYQPGYPHFQPVQPTFAYTVSAPNLIEWGPEDELAAWE